MTNISWGSMQKLDYKMMTIDRCDTSLYEFEKEILKRVKNKILTKKEFQDKRLKSVLLLRR